MYHSLKKRNYAWDRHGELMLLMHHVTLSHTDSSFLLLFFCRRFFQAACEVPELQDKFNIDEYSDLVTLTKPVIYISIGEIINTHTVSIHQSQLLSCTVFTKKILLLAETQSYQIQG